MTVYKAAVGHARMMLWALLAAFLFVMTVERWIGHSTIAFGIAIIGLIVLNAPMLRLNCPNCGKNLFFRGIFVVPWPNKTCGKCGTELDKQP